MNQSTPVPHTLEERLQAGQFVLTAELAPPVSCDAEDLRRKAAPLKGLPDAVNVTDGAGARAHMAALAAASILNAYPAWTSPLTNATNGADASVFMGALFGGAIYFLLARRSVPEEADRSELLAALSDAGR